MKILSTLILCCLALLGFSQNTTLVDIKNPLPKGRIVANGNGFAVQTSTLTPVYLNGTSITGDALNWGTPAEFADRVLYEGINLVRFHHERVDKNGVLTDIPIERLVSLADALYARGLYFCFDVVGDRWMNRKVEVYEGGPIRNELTAEMDRLKPLLVHPGLAYVALVNEGATPLRGKYNANFPRCVAICNETYAWFKTELSKRGYTGLVGDLPDANIDARFREIVAKQDILLVHGYGTHNDGQKWKLENWAQTGVHIGSMLQHINETRKLALPEGPPPLTEGFQAPLAKPAIVQEFACMFPNPDRAMNEMNWRTEFLRRGVSVISYAMATNQSHFRGTFTEIHDFAWLTDPARRISSMAGALLVKYGRGAQTDWYWGHSVGKNDPNYRYSTDRVSVALDKDRGLMKVKVSAKKLIYVVFDQTLVRGLASTDAGGGWRLTTSRGGLIYGGYKPGVIDTGLPVSGAYQDGATLKKSGNQVWPIGPGLVEVNLR